MVLELCLVFSVVGYISPLMILFFFFLVLFLSFPLNCFLYRASTVLFGFLEIWGENFSTLGIFFHLYFNLLVVLIFSQVFCFLFSVFCLR